MKKHIYFAAASIFSVMLLASCKNEPKDIDDAKEDVIEARQDQQAATEKADAAQTDSVSDYARLKAETNKLIADNKTRIAEFKVKLKTESATNQAKFQKQIDKLEARNEELQQDLDSWADKGKERWDAFKSRVAKSVEDINKDIDDYKKEHNY
ncbi:hypothetical protein HYN48_08645 [Flavobacterium magnum]|uniref:Peptidase M23 n=1 Tax=Flavobacterium magnum TaxID=2162713 RepID=A0A2S0RHE6_9FLAO|nr:hypothetical protein [Flavobacterium magnum]AWA30142.1 hypothetical protein HYN48_08645 [Flavobacterium magnum]